MTAPTGPHILLSWEPHHREVAEKLLSQLSEALPGSYVSDESPVAPGDQAPEWDVLVLLLGGSGTGGQSQSARQSRQFRSVRTSGGRTISVLLEGDPRAVASSPIQRNNPMLVLREEHW